MLQREGYTLQTRVIKKTQNSIERVVISTYLESVEESVAYSVGNMTKVTSTKDKEI